MADFIILALIAAYCLYLIVGIFRKQKAGGGCTGCSGFSCSGCSGSCSHEFDNFLDTLEKAEKKADRKHRS